MSKRGAELQMSKDGGFLGDGSNQVSENDTPTRATAAQIANRRIKPLKGRRTAGTTSNSFPGASQPAPGGVGSNPFSFSAAAPAPSNNGFSFSFSGPPSTTGFGGPANDAMDTSVSPQKQPPPSFTQSTSSAMATSGGNLFGNLAKPPSGNIFGQSTSSSNPFQNSAITSTAAPSTATTQAAPSLFGNATSSAPQFSFSSGPSQSQSKAPPANNAPSQGFNFSFGQGATNPPFNFGAPTTSKDAQAAPTGPSTASSAPSMSQPAPVFSLNASTTTKETPETSAGTASKPSGTTFTFGATGSSSSRFSFGAPSIPKPASANASEQPDSGTTATEPSATPSFANSITSSGATSAPFNAFNFASATGNSAGSTNPLSPVTPAKSGSSLFGSTTPAPSFTPSKVSDAPQEPKKDDKPVASSAAGTLNGFNPTASTAGPSTANNMFGNMSPKPTAPTTGTSKPNNLFGNATSKPSVGANNIFSLQKPESNPASQADMEQSTPGESQKEPERNSAPTGNVSAKPALGQPSSGNIFAAAAASKPSSENSEVSAVKTTQPASSVTPMAQRPLHEIEEEEQPDGVVMWRDLNTYFKEIVADTDVKYDMYQQCMFYLEWRLKIRKRLGIARSDDLLEEPMRRVDLTAWQKAQRNGTAEASSPKKPENTASQDPAVGVAGSQTANIFSSIVNKSSQSSSQTATNGAQPPAAGSSAFNRFGASTSKTPVKSGAPFDNSTSTTPAGSPVKRDLFSAQSPSKSAPSGQLGHAETPKLFDTGVAKRKCDALTADNAEGETEENAQEKRQKVDTNGSLRPPTSELFGTQSRSPTPVSSANNGSVLNSGAASPNPHNIFGHLSQDESNGKDDDNDEEEDEDGDVDEEADSSTPTQEPKSGGLFGRITKDDSGKPSFGTPPANGNNIFGFAQTGPVNKTWSGDSESPIKFSTPQPASSATNGSKPFNPFASLKPATSAAPSSGSVSTPFKFNPAPATTSDNGSVFGTASSSRAATPALPSTGASEAEDDETPAPVDTEQIKLRTALTDEDRSTYDVLFDTDSQTVSMMRLVDKTEEELKADPKKQPKKWVTMNKGPLRVLKHKETGAGSILLKAEPVGRVAINTRLQANLLYKRAKPKFAMLSMPLDDGKLSAVYIKFDEDTDCTKFVEVCEANKS